MSSTSPLSYLLSAYLDDELDDAERADVEAGLAGSAELREELAGLERTRSLLRSLPEVEPRRPLVPAGHGPMQGGHEVVAPTGRRRRFAMAVAGVAAVWVVVLSVGVSLGSLPVVPDVDQLALQHAAAETSDTAAEMGFRAMTSDQMADDPVIMDDIGHGMVRDAIFQSDDVVQVRYSDGVHSISVFHQPGDVDWDDMPPSGDVRMMDDGPVWSTTMSGVDVLVAERGDLIVTVVADGDMDQEMTMMASAMVPEVDMDDGLWTRIVDAPGNILDRF